MVCKNCGHEFEGNFCPNCGQSAHTKRIDYGYVVNEIPQSIFKLNRGFLYTIKQLSTRPGQSIRGFIEGQRQPYYKPLPFLLITSTIYILVSYLTGANTFLNDLTIGWYTEEGTQQKMEENVKVIHWVSKNQTYILLLLLPLFSLTSYWAFLKAKYNYFEHLVLNFYIAGQQMLIYSILNSLFYQGYFTQIIPSLVVIVYSCWAYHQFFHKRRLLANLLSIIFMHVYILFLVLTILFTAWLIYGALS